MAHGVISGILCFWQKGGLSISQISLTCNNTSVLKPLIIVFLLNVTKVYYSGISLCLIICLIDLCLLPLWEAVLGLAWYIAYSPQLYDPVTLTRNNHYSLFEMKKKGQEDRDGRETQREVKKQRNRRDTAGNYWSISFIINGVSE